MSAFKLNIADLVFVLKQIKIAEANADGTPLTEIWVDANGNIVPEGTPGAQLAVGSPMAPFGLRTVDGSYNNITPGRELWGAADQGMPRLLTPNYVNEGDDTFSPGGPPITNNNYGVSGSVADADPRIISNLIVDMSANNPAALFAALRVAGSEDPHADLATLMAAQMTQAEADAALAAAAAALSDASAARTAANDALLLAAENYDPLDAPSLATLLAAVAAFTAASQVEAAAQADADAATVVAADPDAAFLALAGEMGLEFSQSGSLVIPNVAPDEGLSRPFNAWMTFFGQFFDHGLDLINKGGSGTVYVPLQNDDPLVVGADGVFGTADDLPANLRFMVLTRATPSEDGSQVNQTTSWVDQNQTYTSHPSHQVFLREYALDGNGRPVATGHLLDGPGGNSLPSWADVKAQALMLGIQLEDRDVLNLPLLRTDAYGKFIPNAEGYAQVIIGLGVDGIPNTADDIVASGTPGSPISTFGVAALRTGHAFLDDIAHNAVPQFVDPDRNPFTNNSVWQTADTDTDTGNAIALNEFGVRLTYDNELLERHYITGDGRGNENVGLTAVHHVFHSEHNRQVEQQKLTILSSGDEAFINEWLATDIDFTPEQLEAFTTMTLGELTTAANGLVWDGERLFQAGRMATEMQYQHLVFEEFARVIQPNIDVFVFNSIPDINGAIFAEFANVVYRFGHSMLTDNLPRIGDDGQLIDDNGLIANFLNPVAYDLNGTISDDAAVGAVIRGMTIERGNEIDEFIVNSLRNNLLGLPLDLAAINIARGRDTGMPTLNQTRQQLFDSTGSTFLEPYDHWTDFAANLKNPISVVNFIAAYGTHSSIPTTGTLEEKRDAAWALVFGGIDAPADRLDFLHGTGAWAGVETGLNRIDLWIGGLAEKQMPFGGMLGSTFNAIFELQLENLQDGDRFYYLTRTQGQNFLNSLEQNAFIKMIMANSDLSDPGPDGIRGTGDDIVTRHVGIDSFGTYDFVYEVNEENQADYDPDNLSLTGVDPVGEDLALEAMGLGKVTRDNLSTDGPDENYLRVRGGEHVVLGGSNENDTLIADFGDDAIWGDAGDDRIEAGAGVDLVNGGAGNDIITDSGDSFDFLKGDEGDDVIANSNGIDIVMGGTGKDVVFLGIDASEVFAGEGDDFVLGGADMDFLLGNEGDDWIEAGLGFDTTAGDNSELFFNSRIIGHDVMFAGGDEHDFDGESGDDIMVQGESVMRNEGQMGFDWVTYKGVEKSADADLGKPIFTNDVDDILRNRFDKVEGLSGWNYDDVLIGDDRVFAAQQVGDVVSATENSFFRDELDLEGLARIEGLDQVITPDMFFNSIYGSDWSDQVKQVFSGGNVIMGGAGDDEMIGKGGDDILDGDKWLNVRIRLTQSGEENTADNEIATIDSLQHVFSAQDFPPGEVISAWVGRSLFDLLLDRSIVPNQMHIVREVLDGGQVGDVDTATFWDTVENYEISLNTDGSIRVDHVGFNQANLPQGLRDIGFLPVSDGIDTLRNIEQLRFGDGLGGFVTYAVAEVLPVPASGAAIISDLTPLEGQALTVDTSTITDPNGVGTLQYQWQRSTNGTTWTDIGGANDSSYTPQDLPLTLSGADAGAQLRVVVSFIDVLGTQEVITSAPTGPVGINWEALIGSTFNGLAGNDFAVGSNLPVLANDTLRGNAGDDSLWGRAGTDILVGGAGNDDLHGGTGTDRADYAGAITNFRFTSDGTTLTIIDTTGAEGTDTAENVENIRFNNINYRVVTGTAGHDTALNGVLGTNDSQLVIGRDGWDTMHGGDGSDILLGGDGSDNVMGGAGDDYIIQYAADVGFDRIDGGAGTNDTYVLHGTDAAETFRIYTRAEAEALGIAIVNASSTIIVTRNGTTTASKIAELRNIEEIVINTANTTVNDGNGVVNGGPAGGDTIEVIGNFVGSGLSYSTITIAGSSANDTVDITGLTSDHRIVFDSNGGTDTLVGAVRPQDVFNGDNLNDQRLTATTAAATDVTSAFGSVDGLNALMGVGARAQLRELGFFAPVTEGLGRGLSPLVERLSLDSDFELTQFVLQTNLDVFENPLAGGMDQMPLDLVELVRPGAGAPGMLSAFEPAHDDRRMLASNVDFLAY